MSSEGDILTPQIRDIVSRSVLLHAILLQRPLVDTRIALRVAAAAEQVLTSHQTHIDTGHIGVGFLRVK